MWEKVVLNLLSNAFKFTFEGEIRVLVRPSADGETAEVTVSDTGMGISAENLPRVFDRFHRVEGVRGRSFEGSGIGLALVQKLVRLPGRINGRQPADAARVARPELKVLFIAGYAENAALRHGHLAPGMHVMTKPFVMDALASRIKGLIAGPRETSL